MTSCQQILFFVFEILLFCQKKRNFFFGTKSDITRTVFKLNYTTT